MNNNTINNTTENYIEVSGYICHALMIQQVLPIEELFEKCKQFVTGKYSKELSKDEFDKILKFLKEGAAITGITDEYIYQTSSTLITQKTHKEIFDILNGNIVIQQ